MRWVAFVLALTLNSICFASVFDGYQIARDSDGRKIRNIHFNEAQDYCARLGMRLPSAREFASLSPTPGIIRETAFPDVPYDTNPNNLVLKEIQENRDRGFEVVFRPNSKGDPTVYFYYRRDEEWRPQGDFRDVYWTSTEWPIKVTFPGPYHYLWFARYQEWGLTDWSDNYSAPGSLEQAVMCIRL